MKKLGMLGDHLNETSSFKVGFIWRLCIVLTTGILALCSLVKELKYLLKVMKDIKMVCKYFWLGNGYSTCYLWHFYYLA